MSKLVWEQIGEKEYETGVSSTALYPFANNAYQKGVAWNGVTGITESPSGAQKTSLYANNTKYLDLISTETYGGTIKAYMSPKEFDACDGVASLATGLNIRQQDRKPFGLAYKSIIGNDTERDAYGYMIRVIYGCLASPSSRDHNTVNESPEASELSWEFSSTPVPVTGFKPTSVVEIPSTAFTTPEDKAKLQQIEDKLFGSETEEPTLLLPDQIAAIINGTTNNSGNSGAEG